MLNPICNINFNLNHNPGNNPTIANTNLNTLNKTTTAPNSTITKALAPNLNTINQLNIQAKAIDIQAGYNGSLNESYHKHQDYPLEV
ncbi:hypothetical protein BSPWISOXPB_7426 [uncultured Gammaproteobacteria bacterium]|nr:hypothetical protein BSPWISOXPB_7426 [uncultured Gammaproteobacteria bacterium]